MKANNILKILKNFEQSEYRKIMISGEWGIGKTKYVLDYVENNNKQSIYISLFGRKDIKSVLEELYYTLIKNYGSKARWLKKIKMQVNKIIDNSQVSVGFFTLNISLMNNLIATIEKEINDELIIVIDDLERKNESLKIAEILGMIDNLTKNNNLKFVIVSSIKNFKRNSPNEVKKFKEYKEKAIDRVYWITTYSEDAPNNILGEEVAEIIKTIPYYNEIKNLRAYIKLNCFLNQVFDKISKDNYSQNFTKEDLIKICFGIIIYITLENEEKKLIKEDRKMLLEQYSRKGYEIDYIYDYILQKNLSSDLLKSILRYLVEYYKTDEFKEEEIFREFEYIKSYKNIQAGFLSSENEVQNEIDYVHKEILLSEETFDFSNSIYLILRALNWCKKLNREFPLPFDDIEKLMKERIYDFLDVRKPFYENYIGNFDTMDFNESIPEYVEKFKILVKNEYLKKLLEEIEYDFLNNRYSDFVMLNNLFNELINDNIDELFLKTIKENDFLYPLPKGKVDDEKWRWCRKIEEIIKHIDERIQSGFLKEFKMNLKERIKESTDKMLIYRLEVQFFSDK